MNNKIIKIGLLGVGKMGQNHLRNLLMMKEVEIGFIYDFDKDTCEKLSAQFGVKSSQNLDEDLQKIDGVIIVTPTFTHTDYIKQVSKYVKNIFVEKPLTDTLESSKEIVKLAKDLNLNIQVGFIERYNSAVVALERVIKNSNHIINIDFSRTNKVSSRITDVDVIIDLMIHDIDLALSINGKPKKVQAHGYVKDGMAEYARAIITHENGSFSNVVASRITEKRIRHISATCDDMYIDCNLLSKEVFVNKQSIEQYLDNVSISSKSETVDVRPQEGLLLELMDFVKICQGETVKVPNEDDGLLAIEVASEIQRQIMEAK
ncbi:Gfo/Idh/MocA family protein [Candidatus Sulfurimonas baltica]|uniref:Gfo/Idh/MocA family oxidoreductase n=1 Tax=Candidatus Sulfurimonas baltica TaxID=2740404 RepID=A0A7S7RNM2_9BACT|nr:Gfo/Idh/MocA family oxidoreductase [Candidatus Sulfurimonas baltica]QOY52679.1 Gfo/Idh/MocA family oxidoreductase [Candidatus Sulfurimonas baltica]